MCGHGSNKPDLGDAALNTRFVPKVPVSLNFQLAFPLWHAYHVQTPCINPDDIDGAPIWGMYDGIGVYLN